MSFFIEKILALLRSCLEFMLNQQFTLSFFNMRNIANNLFRWYYLRRFNQIEQFIAAPIQTQEQLLAELVQTARETEWGKQHQFDSIYTSADFARLVPVQDYNTLKPYIQRMMKGETDILWPGQTKMFSKSSGTTSDKSKFLPVSDLNLKQNHIKGSWDTMTLLYNRRPDCSIFSGKNFLMAGSNNHYEPFPETICGDVSALMIKNMPYIARPFFEPDIATVLQPDWEAKIKEMVALAIQPDLAEQIKMVGGVPTWTIVFFRQILAESGAENMLEVWKNFETYIHGGVSIAPYQEQLQQLLPSDQVNYWEVYNASEGYFASQYELDGDDLLLLLDNGTYFEFLPASEWHSDQPIAIPLSEVVIDEPYALLISTNAGLWRYLIGDTIIFTSLHPHKIKITGRIQQYINVFGEEVIVSNTNLALKRTCTATRSIVSEYTAAPIYMGNKTKGGHEWLIEFEKHPEDLDNFTRLLDENLQAVNTDYAAKRYKDLALDQLRLKVLPTGSFLNWMRHRGKFGNQNKVPRLSNDRKYVEDILDFISRVL